MFSPRKTVRSASTGRFSPENDRFPARKPVRSASSTKFPPKNDDTATSKSQKEEKPQIIAVIGSSAREHAICWKLSESSKVKSIFAIPGNAGTYSCEKVTNHEIPLNAGDRFGTLVSWLIENEVEWVIVGDVNLLAADIASRIRLTSGRNIKFIGLSAIGASIEVDKRRTKQFMKDNGIPTVEWKSFTNPRVAKVFIKSVKFKGFVVKASGFVADGQGVIIADTGDEACAAVDKLVNELGAAAGTIIVEERLQGEEVSIPVFCDGRYAEVMLPVKVRKKLKDQDVGPNTGGMGAVCPFPVSEDQMEFIKEHIIQRMVTKFRTVENTQLFGMFCAELIITADGIKVLGFKCTFGDPEAQVLIPLLDCDLFDIIQVMSTTGFGDGTRSPVKWKKEMSCVGVVMVSGEYPPMNADLRVIVLPRENTLPPNVHLFHGNTRTEDILAGIVLSTGGRMITSVAVDTYYMRASDKAIAAIGHIQCDNNSTQRTDIVSLGFPWNEQVFTEMIKHAMGSTFNSNVIPSVGISKQLYDGSFILDYENPVFKHTCESVGNKFDIAEFFENFTTVGQDLVAKCANNILEKGAKPLTFQEYFSYDVMKPNIASGVINSTVEGCRQAGCVLIVSRKDEMPEFYKDDKCNLAGFLVGAVEKKKELPQDITKGDKIFCLSSSGIHFNLHSLVRQIFSGYSKEQLEELKTVAPFSRSGKSYVEELLTPTAIYTNEVLPLVEKGLIKAFIPISDDGLVASISRIIPPQHKVELDALKWKIPPIFGWIKDMDCIKEQEMLNTLNCGVGAVIVVAPDPMKVHEVFRTLDTGVINEIVEIEDKKSDESPVQVKNWQEALSKVEYNSKGRKRVAVVIFRSGTYLTELIESTRKDPASPVEIVLVIVIEPNSLEHEIGHIRVKRINVKEMLPEGRDTAIMKALEDLENPIDIICFIGFTGLICPDFFEKYNGQIINIHHSLPPAFGGELPEKEALKARMITSGCTVYFAQVDDGPDLRSPLDVIDQRTVPVYYPCDDETALNKRIEEQGREILPRALKWVALGKFKPENTLEALPDIKERRLKPVEIMDIYS